MKILTIIGARPQFIKAAAVSSRISASSNLNEVIIHTGQHYDKNMSDVFFQQLDIPKPKYNLGVHENSHGAMTGRMLMDIEPIIIAEEPDIVIVYGDTNSTLAGAIVAKKLHVKVAHVEAGLRSFNMLMPEEINRILTDQLSDILFCPTETAIGNLEREGFAHKSHHIEMVGDVMQDSAHIMTPFSRRPPGVSHQSGYILATIHRAENTNDKRRLHEIVSALNSLQLEVAPVIIPLHPRTKNAISAIKDELNAEITEPVGYLEMLWLLQHCSLVITDSGGLQKEAFFFNKACVTVRDQTEWTELLDIDANVLVNANREAVINAVKENLNRSIDDAPLLYGGGKASQNIVDKLIAISGKDH